MCRAQAAREYLEIAGDVNRAIGQSGPEVYLRKIKPNVLESQCVPLDRSLWSIDRADDLWATRRDLIAESFNEFVLEALPQRRVAAGAGG